ncbi:Type-1 restriction enzyme R protein [Clostridiales bacterium CHKCI006]|nr:Type-1 restriction enzyme R protein [Clostridiales bacterium CHKCI006]
MPYSDEARFEHDLITLLFDKGWERKVLKYPTEEDLIRNWAEILFENNRKRDRLNDYPLTKGEMQQILEQITELRTPLRLNGFINGRVITIVRDNPLDKEHFGKEVSLKIYDRMEIAAGQSRYQIAEQPVFKSKSKMLNNRRGDLMLLINGMPVIHIELKSSSVPISQACNQIEKYAHEGIFTGLFSLIQVFVAMTPEETLYFANPGPESTFNKAYYFHWADFNNEPINDWKDIASSFLSIPMAHQLIGFYTVADDSDGVLKVMRSYQYYAANAISDKVAKTKWDDKNQLGGYVWHTTGSGKTMTSFKSAQLIANSKDADKVVFLTDRIELGTQSLKEYRSFADDNESVQATENTGVLISKLKSNDPSETLIVTSIQKMSNIKEDSVYNQFDIDQINAKRLVFIVDEAHRSTFGEMLITIKNTFPRAIFFGFTGTPIGEENKKKMNTTETVFGNELHRYSIADGIRDGNILGFDPDMIETFKASDLREAVALDKAKAKSVVDIINDTKRYEIYLKYMDSSRIPMAGYIDKNGKKFEGIEDNIPKSQYRSFEHQKMVVEDICYNWNRMSLFGKFHAIFATSSIQEAIEYYHLFKQEKPDLKVTSLFDSNIDNTEGAVAKEDGLVEILNDYNERYHCDFTIATHAAFKKDVASRLAHKDAYKRIVNKPDEELDLLIVVDQMLTGFDSKWINTLYLDKVLEYENIIQAFSRTNRLFGPEKRFGSIRYYRYPYTMRQNIEKAVKMYSGDKPIGLFVQKLPDNLRMLNKRFNEIRILFDNAGIKDFSKLPDDSAVVGQFVKMFNQFSGYLDAAKIQGFRWDQNEYFFEDSSIRLAFDKTDYDSLLQRYKELLVPSDGTQGGGEEPAYDLDGHLSEIDTGMIDADYMNTRFEKYYKLLKQEGSSQVSLEEALNELHKTFATLSQEDQKYANIFLHDVQSGEAVVEEGKTLKDYIVEYQTRAKDDQIHQLAVLFGLDEDKLRNMMGHKLTDANINEFGRLDDLKKSIDRQKARKYFEELENTKIKIPTLNIKIDSLLRKFILSGGYELAKAEK